MKKFILLLLLLLFVIGSGIAAIPKDILGIVCGMAIGFAFGAACFFCYRRIRKHFSTNAKSRSQKRLDMENLAYILLGIFFYVLFYYLPVMIKSSLNDFGDLVNVVLSLIYAALLILLGLFFPKLFDLCFFKLFRNSEISTGHKIAFNWCKLFGEISLLIYAMYLFVCEGEYRYLIFAVEVLIICANENLSIQDGDHPISEIRRNWQDTFLFNGKDKAKREWIIPCVLGAFTIFIFMCLLIHFGEATAAVWFGFSLWISFIFALPFFQEYFGSNLKESKDSDIDPQEIEVDVQVPIEAKSKAGMLQCFFIGVSVGFLSGIAVFSVHNKFRNGKKNHFRGNG